jgi:hypothetical protein
MRCWTLKKQSVGARKRGGEEIEKILPTDKAVPTLIKQIQRKYFLHPGIGFVSISSVKVVFPTCVIYKKDSGDEHNFCTTLMEKTVGEIGILNSDLLSDQFFFSADCHIASISLRKGTRYHHVLHCHGILVLDGFRLVSCCLSLSFFKTCMRPV